MSTKVIHPRTQKGAGLLYSPQLSFGSPKEIIGFGADHFNVREIDRKLANSVIEKNHYSKKYFNNSYIHLGVFVNEEMFGVLQYGHLLNNKSIFKIVPGTKKGGAVELNRMWMSDVAGRNSESMAISYSMKYIKSKFRNIKWVQSFADERCGGLGIVYQACSFSYYGYHVSKFYTDGESFYHNIQVTASRDKAGTQVKDKSLLKCVELKQYRYIKFLDQRVKKNCSLKEMPYPKHYA